MPANDTMESRSATTPGVSAAPLDPGAPHQPRGTGLYLVVLVLALGLTPLLVLGEATYGFSVVAVVLVGGVLATLVVWRPIIGVYAVAICAVVIEQNPLPPATQIFTNQLYIFYWPPRLDGVMPERPIGFLILLVLGAYIAQRLATRQPVLRGGALLWPFLFFLACVVMGIAHGLTSGGTFRIIVLEVRPFWYLFVCYLLAYNLVTEKRHVMTLLWITILGTAFKALQGVYIIVFFLHGHLSGQNEIMAHEQSFFFILVLLLLLLFWLHHAHKPQMWAILVTLPFLLPALVANNRRADYVALAFGGVVVWLLVIAAKPQTRAKLIVGLAICAVLGTGYVVAFAHDEGSLGAPAHAIMAIISPSSADARDIASNLYRDTENFDLKYTEKQSPILGYGFGKPFLQPEQLPNIIGADTYYLYIPHNNIYWIWMRLGPIGFFALWYLFGSIMVRGSLIARRLTDPMMQLVAIYVVGAMFMEVLVAYGDYQLFFYRNVMYMGIMIGVLMKLPHLRQPQAMTHVSASGRQLPTDEDPRRLTPRSPAHIGNRRPQLLPVAGTGSRA